jgi:hypothetical protein
VSKNSNEGSLTYYIFEKYSVVIGASGESLVCIVAAFAGELFLNLSYYFSFHACVI